MFLTKELFLEHFPKVNMTRDKFIDTLMITYKIPLSLKHAFTTKPIKVKDSKTHKIVIIKPRIKSASDPRNHRDKVINYLYQMVITHRHYYLGKFYDAYFHFKNPFTDMKWNSSIDITLPKTSIEKGKGYAGNLSLQKNDAARHIVRNLFYLELLHLTKVTNTVKSSVSFWQALENLYNHLKLEDRFFAPSSVGLFIRPKTNINPPKDIPPPPASFRSGFNANLNYHNLFYLFQGYLPKASIINPYAIHWMLENIFTGKTILSPVLSWGSYLIGYMHSAGWNHYVGIDVMPSACKKVDFLGKYYHKIGGDATKHKKVDIICQASEKLAKNKAFLSKYHNYFDLVIICPPYYDMEVYHEGEQSTELYPSYDLWLQKYWYPTTQMSYSTCKKGGTFAMIVNNYYTLSGDYYPLVEDLSELAIKSGFKFVKFYYLFNRTSPLRMNTKDRTERLVIFKKT